MAIYYKDGFYNNAYGGFVPESAVEISEEKYVELLEGQANGKRIVTDKNGHPVLADPPQVSIEIQRAEIRTKINAKRDECVDGGAYVPLIDKWVDSDEKGRATLVEIKADFDLNGKDNTYTLICADNTAKTINYEEFKAVWDAVKTLKEQMFENAYMHKILLEQAEDPKDYDWSIGWSKTYKESLNAN
ncbi:DUF4376 domain-containing protein [Rodentibacter myodis]|uniref:DUF4376 domain-containing protein n=1 Tax=Rodentibacter myodis TaxID=1907939 RepID=A0A1V3JRX7_9PAST|nr:DUF4376 domain-containing protein [Rodentibacter myodis]OOF59406.1 hypothetical protein BKL49_04190 [Rodentibacter myodis]